MGSLEMLTEEFGGGAVKVVLRGRFDTTGAIHVEMPFNAIVRERDLVVVDLSGVSFMSSYGIRVLLFGAKMVDSRGGRLALACPAGNVAKVLQSARTNELIPVFPTPEAALAAVS